MQCIVKEVYSSLVVEVVWWDSPLLNIGDVVDISIFYPIIVMMIRPHVVTMCVIVPLLKEVFSVKDVYSLA